MDCVFCKIVKGELEHVRFWENNEFLGVLDVNPTMEGQALVLMKEHHNADVFTLPDDIYLRLFLAAKKVVPLMERGLGVKRVAMVMEGLGINHAHLKLYPLHGLTDKHQQVWAKDKVNFDTYEGYISTQLGKRASTESLRALAERMK